MSWSGIYRYSLVYNRKYSDINLYFAGSNNRGRNETLVSIVPYYLLFSVTFFNNEFYISETALNIIYFDAKEGYIYHLTVERSDYNFIKPNQNDQ